jgi:tetratricopeptide (TPR) repeat protein
MREKTNKARQTRPAKLLFPLLAATILAGTWGFVSWHRTHTIHAHLARALQAARQGQGPAAEAEWQAALRLDPKNGDIYEMQAEYQMSSGQWGPAAASFRALTRVAPQTPHILCRLAACLLRQDDQKGAYETANDELRRDPNCVAALGLVTSIMVLQSHSDAKLRLEYMRRLARLAPGDVDFLHMYAEELTNRYLYDELRPVVAQILKAAPHDAEAYNLLGYADLARPDQPAGVQQAIRDFQTSLAINPANGGAHFGLGRAELRLGQARAAIAHLETALRMRPDAAKINYELSNAYRMAGLPQQAAAAKDRYANWQRVALEYRRLEVRCIAYPQDPQYPRQLGQLLLRSGGDSAEAVYYLKKAQQLAPGDATVATALSRLQNQPAHANPAKIANAGPIPFH